MKNDVTIDIINAQDTPSDIIYSDKVIAKDKKIVHHNGIISFWKFMFTIMIAIYHGKMLAINGENIIFRYGKIGVEFFFLVSGYFMCKKALNKKEDCSNIGRETFQYIWEKIMRFFPYVLVAFLVELSIGIVIYAYPIHKIINSIWDLLLVQMSGIKTTRILIQAWYLSAMLISMFILYPLIRKYKSNFIYFLAPIIIIFVGGWLSHTKGNLDAYASDWTGIMYAGLLRAFLELTIGTIIYEIVKKVKKIEFTKFGKSILTVIEIVGFISIFFIVNIKNANNKYDFVMLLILSISTLIAFSEKTMLFNFSNNKFFYYLERLSFPVYLNHRWVMLMIGKIFIDLNYWEKLGISVFLTIIFSIIIMYVIEKIKGKPKKIAEKLFIEK